MKYPPLTWGNLILSAILFMAWPVVLAECVYVAWRHYREQHGQEA